MARLNKDVWVPHVWAPHKAQRKHETLYHLRQSIRNGVDADDGLYSVRNVLGEDLEALLDEVLQSKCDGDGQTLLTFAASQGSEAWLLRLVDEIRTRSGLGAVVKGLKEVDNNGAPLLFHAASSRRDPSCFQTARALINTVLGKGGLMEQIQAVDFLGRGILMHAARSNHVNSFNQVFGLLEEASLSGVLVNRKSTLLEGSDMSEVAGLVLPDVIRKFDHMGMSCLHHAAEAGSYGVLREVMDRCVGAGSSIYEEMDKADNLKRTPIMLVLRDTCRGKNHGGLTNIQKDKFHLLFEAMPYGPAAAPGAHNRIGWMCPTLVPSSRVRTKRISNKRPDACPTRAVTELIHAVRGGLAALKLALNNPLPSTTAEYCGGFTVHLDKALAVEEQSEDGDWVQTDTTRVWGRALLLAAASRHGDIQLLHAVLAAIEIGEFRLLGKIGDACLEASCEDPFREAPACPEVKHAVEAIDAGRFSLFCLAIMSRQTNMVMFVYDLVVAMFGKKSEAWVHLNGHHGSLRPLTCAAFASMEDENHGIVMFDTVYSLLIKAAPGPDDLADQ
eukprot:g9667.t1